jgi:hypothetical protein
MPSTRTIQVTRVLGALALVVVPSLFVGLLVVPFVVLTRVGPTLGVAVAVFGGVVAAGTLGPAVVDRRIASLPRVGSDDDRRSLAESRVAAIAAQLGVDRPTVTVVSADAANVAVTDGHRGSRLVVTTRLLSLPPSNRDAALRHAISRLQRREAAVTTAALPGLVAVETVALAATLVVSHEPDRRPADRRANRIHGYEPDRDRIPAPLYTAGGLLAWLVTLPVWLPAAVGDRLFVGGGRRDADAVVARTDDDARTGLASAISFTEEAPGASDWPPLLDRLSVVSMADATTERVRGTSRHETRCRLAQLRSKRSL